MSQQLYQGKLWYMLKDMNEDIYDIGYLIVPFTHKGYLMKRFLNVYITYCHTNSIPHWLVSYTMLKMIFCGYYCWQNRNVLDALSIPDFIRLLNAANFVCLSMIK